MMIAERTVHPIPPEYDDQSKVLILGSFPSVRSRAEGFFYAHQGNRFWKIMEALYSVPLPDIPTRKTFLHENHIALWDTVASCIIRASDDSSITEVIPNDLSPILSKAGIRSIFTNGRKSYDLYMKLTYPKTGIPPVLLPSTSPANAAWKLDALLGKWKVIKECADSVQALPSGHNCDITISSH